MLVGEVVKAPKLSTSPAGIHHCQFSIDHKSIQIEEGMNRQSFVRMRVVATGQWSQNLTRDLTDTLSPRPPNLAILSRSITSIINPFLGYLCKSVYGNKAKKRARLIARPS